MIKIYAPLSWKTGEYQPKLTGFELVALPALCLRSCGHIMNYTTGTSTLGGYLACTSPGCSGSNGYSWKEVWNAAIRSFKSTKPQVNANTGMHCAVRVCAEFNHYAQPNQPDGRYVCWGCRSMGYKP